MRHESTADRNEEALTAAAAAAVAALLEDAVAVGDDAVDVVPTWSREVEWSWELRYQRRRRATTVAAAAVDDVAVVEHSHC